MPAIPAPSAAPPNAIPLWTDGRSLFAELPGPSGPVVLRYPLTTSGLSSALGLVDRYAYDSHDRAAAARALRPTNPIVESLLRSMGIIS